jgi:hypothetical protein
MGASSHGDVVCVVGENALLAHISIVVCGRIRIAPDFWWAMKAMIFGAATT